MTTENKPLPAIPAKRYFTIGEVSELCGVKAYVLRYWEQEFTQLKPMKRRGNRRYYQHHEVLLIRRIRDLLYEQGFTISGARNQLVDAGVHAHVHAAADAPDALDEAPLDADDDTDEIDAAARAHARRDPAARTRASDLPNLAPARPLAAEPSHADTDAERADPFNRGGAGALDDDALAAMARDDVAVIERIGRERGEIDADTSRAAVAATSRTPAANAGNVRSAALQARKTAGSASAPSPASGVYDTEQIRAELLAIRALLVS